ncbi:MAG: hypothetical protein J0L62_01690 [Bacteroidetes bacterium]|nr:hypothetical protein [Bacteroidota bacterium]
MKRNPRLFTLIYLAILTSIPVFGQENPTAPATTTAPPPLPVLSAPADTLTPQVEKGIIVAEAKLAQINQSISKSPAEQPQVVAPIPGDTTKAVPQSTVSVNIQKLISETDSLLYELRLRVELLDPKIPKTQISKRKVKSLQESSKQLLVKSSAAHIKYAEGLDFADKNLTEALSLLEKTNSAPSAQESETNQTENPDSTRQNSGPSVDIKANLLSARKLVIDADSTLNQVAVSIPGLDQKLKETSYLSERHHSLKVLARDLKNLTASAGMTSTVASRRLIDPAADWDFDAKTPLTTDPRVNPVKSYLDKNLGENGNIFKTIAKDSMLFTFRVPDAWRKFEKFKYPVISYSSPDKKIIITINQSLASVDSLHYWAGIYEASSYGKNQFSDNYTKFPKSRAQSFGADQTYVAKYHYGSKEIAALFLQRKGEVVSAFVEYPNGSLNDSDTGIINLFLNSLKYKDIK